MVQKTYFWGIMQHDKMGVSRAEEEEEEEAKRWRKEEEEEEE
jgi:hypothetical protein